jgi:hypothetical protein
MTATFLTRPGGSESSRPGGANARETWSQGGNATETCRSSRFVARSAAAFIVHSCVAYCCSRASSAGIPQDQRSSSSSDHGSAGGGAGASGAPPPPLPPAAPRAAADGTAMRGTGSRDPPPSRGGARGGGATRAPPAVHRNTAGTSRASGSASMPRPTSVSASPAGPFTFSSALKAPSRCPTSVR